MVVVIAGMPKSGSTWSFNVARVALSSKGSTLRLMAADSLPEDSGMFIGHHARHLILKSHFPDAHVLNLLKTVAAKGIATLRDSAEASRSLSIVGKRPQRSAATRGPTCRMPSALSTRTRPRPRLAPIWSTSARADFVPIRSSGSSCSTVRA